MYNNQSNLILGFHGCDESVRDSLIISPNKINKSEKPYDWLGHGIYFWEGNYKRAMQWAKDKEKAGKIKRPSVVGAVIALNRCLDFTDTQYIEMIQTFYNLMESEFKFLQKELPRNKDVKADNYKDKIIRELDCAVIEYMHDKIMEENSKQSDQPAYEVFDSARGIFTEGGPAFPGAGIQSKSHIQICIRNINCIKGFFMPRAESNFP